jgi:hypothetical protein
MFDEDDGMGGTSPFTSFRAGRMPGGMADGGGARFA